MNDQDKIRALMIYYDHWGKEQNKLRDFMATMNKIKNVFVQKDKDNYHFLTEVQFLEIHIPLGYCKFHVLNDMANELLSGLGGVVRAPNINSRASKLAKNLRKSVFEILQNVVDTDQMRAIDAIVAL